MSRHRKPRHCTKTRYDTRVDAEIALSSVILRGKRGKRSSSRQESRAYECDRCGGFHLTSMGRT